MIALERLHSVLAESTFQTLYALSAAVMLALAVFLPRRLAPLLVALVAAAFVGGSIVASDEIADRSQLERDRTFAGAAPDWIDQSGATNVMLLLTGDRFWPSAWQEVFWNDAIHDVARIRGAESPGLMPQYVVTPKPDGTIETPGSEALEYLAAPASVTVAGDRAAEVPGTEDQPGIALWRVEQPLRLEQRVTGIRPNGDLHGGESARVRVFGCGPGRLELTLLGKQGLPTRVLLDGHVVAERTIPPDSVWRPRVPGPADADGTGTCVFTLQTDGLIGSTRVEWVPESGS
jgi:hypothetical protein